MRIEILDEAEEDLIEGFAFYERQTRGWETTFSIPSSPTLNPFTFMPGFTLCTSGITDFLPSGSPLLSITGFRMGLFGSMPYSIADEVQPGFADASHELQWPNRVCQLSPSSKLIPMWRPIKVNWPKVIS